MYIVNIKWHKDREHDDSFSYDSFPLALKETERYLDGILKKPHSIEVFEGETKHSPNRKLIASLRILR